MENKWLLLSVISDSDLGRSYDTIRIKSKYIALWYIFDKYLPLIIFTKLILTLYVTSWLLLQSNLCICICICLCICIFIFSHTYIYIHTYSACRAFVIHTLHSHVYSIYIHIYILFMYPQCTKLVLTHN